MTNISGKLIDRMRDNWNEPNTVFFPEVYNDDQPLLTGIPLTPREIIDRMPSVLLKYDYIFTTSEHVVLFLLKCIRDKTVDDLDVIYVADGFTQQLRVDENGEFIDRVPSGFFRERSELLF